MNPNDTFMPAARLAARTFRRDLRRQLRHYWLVILLIAVPVAVGAYVAVAQRTAAGDNLTDGQRMMVGDATAVVLIEQLVMPPMVAGTEGVDPPSAERIDAVIAALQAEADDVLVVRHAYGISGPMELSGVVAADWTGPLADSAFLSVEGRLPTSVGEVALTPARLKDLEVDLGDTFVTVDRSQATVVGVVETHSGHQDWESVIMPAARLNPDLATSLTIGVAGLSVDETRAIVEGTGGGEGLGSDDYWIADGLAPGITHYSNGFVDPLANPEQAGTLTAAALLIQTALLAAAAFIVRGRRRGQEIDRLSALGADQRQIKWMLLTEAAIIGLIGSLLGVVGAVGAAHADVGLLLAAGRSVSGYETANALAPRLLARDLIPPVVVAVAAAMVAAWLPARRAASGGAPRALAARDHGRSTPWQPALPPRFIWLAPLLVITAVILAVAGGWWEQLHPGTTFSNALVVLALLTLLAAIMVAAAAVVSWIGGRGDEVARIPVSARIGLRQLARHRARSVVIVGAAAVICTLAVTVAVLLGINQSRPLAGATMAYVSDSVDGDGRWLDLGHLATGSPDAPDAGTVTALAAVAEHVDYDTSAALQFASRSDGSYPAVAVGALSPDDLLLEHEFSVVVATDELLDLLDLDDADRGRLSEPATVAVASPATGGQGTIRWFPASGRGEVESSSVAMVAIDHPELAAVGAGAFMAPENFGEGMVMGETSAWLIQSADGFSAGEIAWMEEHGLAWYPHVNVPWRQDREVQLVLLAIASILVLIVARVAVALVAVEADSDVGTMVSLGAPPRVRRHLLGVQAGLLMALAVALSVPAGVGLAATLTGINPYLPGRVAVPLYLAAGLAILPVVVGALVAVTSRSAPTVLSRRLT